MHAGCPLAGFVRFLHLLSTHPWKDRPLTVDPTSQLTPAQHRDIQSRFDQGKASKAVKGFCICSPSDLEGLFWAQEHMSSALQHRLVKLASRSLNLLQVQPSMAQRTCITKSCVLHDQVCLCTSLRQARLCLLAHISLYLWICFTERIRNNRIQGSRPIPKPPVSVKSLYLIPAAPPLA